jgi:hypothetical protein
MRPSLLSWSSWSWSPSSSSSLAAPLAARAALVGVLMFAAASARAADAQTFGKPLKGVAPSTLEQVLAAPEAGKLVRLEGTIEAVCKNKGCWLELKQGPRSVHVTFEGYSFFVPKDAMGKACVLEGKLIVKEPSPDEVEHKASEGASRAAQKVSVEATGVEIRAAR